MGLHFRIDVGRDAGDNRKITVYAGKERGRLHHCGTLHMDRAEAEAFGRCFFYPPTEIESLQIIGEGIDAASRELNAEISRAEVDVPEP